MIARPAARAREAKGEQAQPLDIPRFQFWKTGNNRAEQADRQQYPALA
jgi:hypothetical protein